MPSKGFQFFFGFMGFFAAMITTAAVMLTYQEIKKVGFKSGYQQCQSQMGVLP